MEYVIYGTVGIVGFIFFNFLRKLNVGKSMQRDIFQEKVKVQDIKWWKKDDGRFLLPLTYDGQSTLMTLFTNAELSEWSVAIVSGDEWVDITDTYKTRQEARMAVGKLQESGVIEVHYTMAQFKWNQAIQEGRTL
jgi:hypothetical protein